MRHWVFTLVETAGTFYMLQACMQGSFSENLENSVNTLQFLLQVNPLITNRSVQRKKFVIEELRYKQTEEKSCKTLNY